jgi:hypothetical protein
MPSEKTWRNLAQIGRLIMRIRTFRIDVSVHTVPRQKFPPFVLFSRKFGISITLLYCE